MSKGRTVQLADPRADEARPATVSMIAVAAGGLGVLLMLGLARVLPGGPPPVHRVFPQSLEAATASETSVHAATVATVAAVVKPAQPAEPADPSGDPAPDPGPPEAAGTPEVALALVTTGQDEATGTSADQPAPPAPTVAAPAPSSGLPEPGRVAAAPPAHADPLAVEDAAKGTRAGDLARPAVAPKAVEHANRADPAKAVTVDPAARAKLAEDLALLTRSGPAKRRAKPVFEPGVVAYVRCEGSEQQDARFPCPRDRKLEERVWHVLGQLADCTEADPGRGSAELRLTLQKTRVQSADFRSSAGGPSLNLRAVTKCTSARLANARTSLKGPHAVVSFRFALK